MNESLKRDKGDSVMQNNQKWIPIRTKLPPLGACIMVTIRNYFNGGRRELRYPVYYMEKGL